jgi:hypothetical protein
VTRRVGLENGQLVTKGENFGLQGGAGSKTRNDHRQKCDEKRVPHGDDYGLTNGRKLRVFRLDGVLGMHSRKFHVQPTRRRKLPRARIAAAIPRSVDESFGRARVGVGLRCYLYARRYPTLRVLRHIAKEFHLHLIW